MEQGLRRQKKREEGTHVEGLRLSPTVRHHALFGGQCLVAV